MQVLLTGASGAIGSALAPALSAQGHAVRALARNPLRVDATTVSEIATGDVSTGAGLDAALDGCEVAYYLVHAMESSAAGGALMTREQAAAERFAAAARRAGVRRVVYLGGLVPADRRASAHLAARLAVEQELLTATPEAVALRASIVISAASRSFRFLVRLADQFTVDLGLRVDRDRYRSTVSSIGKPNVEGDSIRLGRLL